MRICLGGPPACFPPRPFFMAEIQVRPHCGGWQAFESPGVAPFFAEKREAVDYAIQRMRSRTGEIEILDAAGAVEWLIPFSPGRTPDLSFDGDAR